MVLYLKFFDEWDFEYEIQNTFRDSSMMRPRDTVKAFGSEFRSLFASETLLMSGLELSLLELRDEATSELLMNYVDPTLNSRVVKFMFRGVEIIYCLVTSIEIPNIPNRGVYQADSSFQLPPCSGPPQVRAFINPCRPLLQLLHTTEVVHKCVMGWYDVDDTLENREKLFSEHDAVSVSPNIFKTLS